MNSNTRSCRSHAQVILDSLKIKSDVA